MRPFDDGRIHMHGEEEIGVVLVGDGCSLVERDNRIVVARQDHARFQSGLERGRQSLADRQRGILLHQPCRSDRADLFPAVAGIDNDGMDPGRLERLRRAERLGRPRPAHRTFSEIEDDAKRILQPVGVTDNVRGSELNAEIVAGKRRPGDVWIFVCLLRIRHLDRASEANRVSTGLLDNRVLGRCAECQYHFRDALHVGHRDLNANRGRLPGMNLQQARGRVPYGVESRRSDQKTLKELPRHERPVVDRNRRYRHLDQIVFDDAETTVGPESSDGVVERCLKAVSIARYRPAQRVDDLVGSKVRLAVLVSEADGAVAIRRPQRGLVGGVRGNRRRDLCKKEKSGSESDRGERESAGHTHCWIIAWRIRRALAGPFPPRRPAMGPRSAYPLGGEDNALHPPRSAHRCM